MMNTPFVSVLMTSYNSEKYIGEAIKSVLNSTFSDFELIICDDKSTDNTVKIAQSYLEKDNRIKLHINQTNLGDYLNRNKVASYAKGTYLKYLDSDDKIYPWGLGVMVHCMQAYPEAGFGLLCSKIFRQTSFPILVDKETSYRHYFFDNALNIGPSGAIISRQAFEAVGGFSGKLYVGDTELWLTLSQKFNLVRMPNDLIWCRSHEMQQSKNELRNPLIKVERYKVYERALVHELCPLPNKERLIALQNLKKVSIRIGAINCLKNSQNILAYYIFCKSCNFKLNDFLIAFTKVKQIR